MAPRKKTIKNAFYFFMLDVKAKEESNGRVFPGGLKDVAEIASRQWSKMGFDEKEPYNRKAAEAKRHDNEDLTRKFTSLGVSYATLDAEERELEEANQLMIETVKKMVRSLPRETELKCQEFFVCHVNYFYKNDRGVYCPAEIALGVFSLKHGMKRFLHSFIDPGKMHLGYRFEATDWSQKTHNIPFDDPKWSAGEKDYHHLLCRIMAFLKAEHDYQSIPPIFTMADSLNNNTSISAVKSVFQTMCEAADEDPAIFRIFPLPLLFFELRNHCVDDSMHPESRLNEIKLPTVAMAEHEIEKDVFTYARNVGCEFHEEKDLATYCSLSIIARWIYTVCDHCCMHLGIPLVLGKHCPKNADVERNACSWKFEPKEAPKNEAKDRGNSSKDNSFMPTIIDHGKLREQYDMELQNTSRPISVPTRADVRLPKNNSYSTAIKNRLPGTSSAAGPSTKNLNFPKPTDSTENACYVGGRGRGFPCNAQSRPDIQPGYWPVSGRGSRMNL